MVLNYQSKVGHSDNGGRIYCKVKDKESDVEIESNYCEVRDARYWGRNLMKSIDTQELTNIKSVTPSSLPQVFECKGGVPDTNVPYWIDPVFSNRVKWIICPVLSAKSDSQTMNLYRCQKYAYYKCHYIDKKICPKDVTKIDNFKAIENKEGSLIVTSVKASTKAPDVSYILMCYSYTDNNYELMPITRYYYGNEGIFNTGIIFDGREQTVNQELKLISPPVQEVDIYAQKKTSFEIKTQSIAILYHSNNDAVYTWYFNGNPINVNSLMKLEKYSIEFISDILPKLAGEYKLVITQQNKSISAIVNVKVLGYPKLENNDCMPPVRYVEEGKSTWMSCDYINRPDKMMLKINNQEISMDKSSKYSKHQLTQQYLKDLQFNVTLTNHSSNENIRISYELWNVSKSIVYKKYQDHIVTFIGSNKMGTSMAMSSIYVVPSLSKLIKEAPSDYNCTNQCSSMDAHNFRCQVDLSDFDNKELSIDAFWSVGKYRLGKFNDTNNIFNNFFHIDPKTNVLTLLPIRSSNPHNYYVKKQLEDNFIDCNINIKGHPDAKPSYNYYSNLDESTKYLLRATIKLDYQPKTSLFYLTIIAIPSMIIIVIITIILVCFCWPVEGDDYQVDKMERTFGNNPLNEFKDEIFKPYQRSNEDLSNALTVDFGQSQLSLASHSLFSTSYGELDIEDLDIIVEEEDGVEMQTTQFN